MKEQNLAEEFRKIIDNMSDEELNQKLKEFEALHNVGPKADDYLEFLEENKQKFKKGDFIVNRDGRVGIFDYDSPLHTKYSLLCVLNDNELFVNNEGPIVWLNIDIKIATEEEKQLSGVFER